MWIIVPIIITKSAYETFFALLNYLLNVLKRVTHIIKYLAFIMICVLLSKVVTCIHLCSA